MQARRAIPAGRRPSNGEQQGPDKNPCNSRRDNPSAVGVHTDGCTTRPASITLTGSSPITATTLPLTTLVEATPDPSPTRTGGEASSTTLNGPSTTGNEEISTQHQPTSAWPNGEATTSGSGMTPDSTPTSGEPAQGGSSSSTSSTRGQSEEVHSTSVSPSHEGGESSSSTDSNRNTTPVGATVGDPSGATGRPTNAGQIPSSSIESSLNTGAIIGGILGALALIAICIVTTLVIRRRRRYQRVAPSTEFMQRYGHVVALRSPSPTPTGGYEDEGQEPSNYRHSRFPSQD